MSLDLDFDDAQRAIADAVARFCSEQCTDDVVKATAGAFPADLWKGLAELGILGLVTAEGEGGAVELVAAMEAFGRAVFPGPLAATFFATQVLGDEDRVAVATGRAVVSVGVPPLMPWAPVAQRFVEIDGERAWLCEPQSEIHPVATLGGEPWGRVALARTADLGSSARALALSDLALAAYLAAAGQRLVDDAAEHARSRRQFGRPIGDFQAVAHPLADCAIRLGAASALARAAGSAFDAGDARSLAAAARLSAARAGVEAAHACHQVFGAIGITLEGPAFHISRRVRQLASLPPGESPAREAVLEPFGL